MNKPSQQNRFLIVIIGVATLLVVVALAQGLVFSDLPTKAADVAVDWELGTCAAVDESQFSDYIKQPMCERLTPACFWRKGPPGRCLADERGNYPTLVIDLIQSVGGDYQVKTVRQVTKDFTIKPTWGEGYLVAVRTDRGDYIQTFTPIETVIVEDFTDQGIKLVDYSETVRKTVTVEIGTGSEYLVDPNRYKIIIKPCDSYDDDPDNDCSLENALFADKQQPPVVCGAGNSPDGSCCQCNNGQGVDVTAAIQAQCSESNLLYCQFNYGTEAFADYNGNCQPTCDKLTTIKYSCSPNQIETIQLPEKGPNEQGTIFCFGGQIKIHSATFGGAEGQ